MKQKLPLYLVMLLSVVMGIYILQSNKRDSLSSPAALVDEKADEVSNSVPQQVVVLSQPDLSGRAKSTAVADAGTAEMANDLGASKQELVHSLALMTDFSVAELENMKDVQAFSERVLNMATAGLLATEQNYPDDLPPVNFSAEPAGAGDYMSYTAEFPSGIPRIYANFSTVNHPAKTVIGKWYRSDVAEVYSFQRYPVDAMQAENYVWYQMEGGWQPGTYGLDIISADEDLRVLTRGLFTVVE